MNALLANAANSLAWALLDFVWQGLLVGCGAALLLALMRNARPQARYAVACGALLLCAALPVSGMLQRMAEGGTTTMLAPLAAAVPQDEVRQLAPAVALEAGQFAGWEDALAERLPLVVLCWSVGAGVLALRMALGLAWVRRRSRPGQYRCDPYWQARLDALALRFGIARRVTLGLVDDLASPVTAGAWRPVVLVPAALVTGMPPQLLEALLAHELAHVRRWDYLVNLLQSAIEILLFYHPAVWWLSKRIRSEREEIADDLAASELGEPRRLALALSELDLFQFTPQLAPGAHGGNLMSRIKRLVRPEAEPHNWKLAFPILGLATCAAFYAWTAPAHAAKDELGSNAPRVVHTAASGEPYAMVRSSDKGFTTSGGSDDWGQVKAARRLVQGDFLWFRESGKAYYIQDPAVMAKANAAWAPVDRLGKQMDVHDKEMGKVNKKVEALAEQMNKAAQGAGAVDEGAMRHLEGDMHANGEEMQALHAKLAATSDAAERERIERRLKEVADRMGELGKRIAQAHDTPQVRKSRAEMEAIGKKMSEASKPMSAIGKRMGELSVQMERASKAADLATRDLIRDARARGLARPVPAAG